MRRALALGLPLLAALLGGCGKPPAATKLFPLEPGRTWVYRSTSDLEDNSRAQETLTLRTLAPDVLTVEQAADPGPAWHRHSDGGADYWLRADDSGIYRVASKSEIDAGPQPDAARRYVLKAPYTVGTQWQTDTTPYLLLENTNYPRESRYRFPTVPMLFSITAVDAAVESDGRRYSGCTKAEGNGQVRIFSSSVGGWRDVPIVAREWYCPGVGLVRLEREELVGSSGLVFGGRLVMELMDEG
ncbi:hypothetical protein [Methylibium sp.]|uniref:hypothetical protein n=1 Tax=Methylibium sp. TaxID=2067992 RepID=UPI003D0B87EF